MASSSKKSKSASRSWQWNHIHLSFFMLAIAALLSLLVGTVLYSISALDIPDISSLGSYNPPLTTMILDDQGEVLAEFYRQRRYVVPVEKMAALLPKAFVAAEDGRFYQHGGVDGWSVLRALLNNIRSGRRSQGGSTITQQVTRSLLLSPEKTYSRKIREAILAYRIDRFLDKEAILYLYLNQIYLGEGAYGVEAAARIYFDKHAGELNLAEISLLAGLPQAPSRYSPFVNFKLAKGRQRYVLNRMAADGYITAEEARRAYRRVLRWRSDEKPADSAEKYFVEHVRRYIEGKYGSEALLTGGLTVQTTMNRPLQKAAAEAVELGIGRWRRRNSGSQRPQAAIVAMEVGSGRVVAMIGGTDFDSSQYNRAVQSKRQPGSAFKPILYATALRRHLTPADIILDEPLKLQGAKDGEAWEPKNFSGEFYGPTTVWTGLVKSRNIVAIKILQTLGIDQVRQLAGWMGISSPLTDNLSLALGSSGMSLLELTNAYNVFASNGIYRTPQFIARITDRHGRILEKGTDNQESRRVVPPKDAYLITDLLKGVIESGTGRAARGLPVEAAGKTGTSDRNMDAWFVGYTPELVAGVWLGFDKGMPLGRVETGGRAAAPLWYDFMKRSLQISPAGKKKFPVPDGVIFLPMETVSGKIKKEGDKGVVMTAFKKDMLPVSR